MSEHPFDCGDLTCEACEDEAMRRFDASLVREYSDDYREGFEAGRASADLVCSERHAFLEAEVERARQATAIAIEVCDLWEADEVDDDAMSNLIVHLRKAIGSAS